MTRYAYIRPLREDNTDAETLRFFVQERGLKFYAYLMDGNGEYDGEHFATRQEAFEDLKRTAADMGWDWAQVEFSVDE